jgi:rSAM/selenodomain-associated transferase 1
MDARRALVLFGRYPLLGRTKTRLAAALGDRETLLLYEALLADTAWKLGQVSRCRHVAALAELPADGPLPRDPLCRDPFEAFFVSGQRGEGFGERLANSMRRGVEDGGGPAVLVGADSPELTVGTLESAFALLDDHDLVMGPAADGGYYLVAMARFHPELFEGIAWSTDVVLAQTEAVAGRLGLRVGRVETLADLDTAADLAAFAERRRRAWSEGGPSPCPATDAWLRGMLPGQASAPTLPGEGS